MESEPFDERIVIRVPSDLKETIQAVANEEDTTLTGAARILIREGLDSKEKTEKLQRKLDLAFDVLNDVVEIFKKEETFKLTTIQDCVILLESEHIDEKILRMVTDRLKKLQKDSADNLYFTPGEQHIWEYLYRRQSKPPTHADENI